MRRTLLGLAAVTLALTAVPAFAEGDEVAEPVLLEACAAVPAGDRLTVDGLETPVDTPLLPGDVSTRTVTLDLAGQPTGTTASIGTTVTWTVSANDYDLTTSGGGDSAKFNVAEMPPFEEAFASGVGHCDSFTISVTNFAAPVVVDTLGADLAVTLEEPVEDVEF